MSALGLFLREELKRHNWIQADLAAILGWRPSAVSALMTGRRRVTPEIAGDLEDAFQVPAMRFLEIQSAEIMAELDADPIFAAKLEGIRARAAYLTTHGHLPGWTKCPHCKRRMRVVPDQQAVA